MRWTALTELKQQTQTVKEFAKLAFEEVNLEWDKYIVTSEEYLRPNEVEHLLGDPTKAQNELGWTPKTSLDDLIDEMIQHELENL